MYVLGYEHGTKGYNIDSKEFTLSEENLDNNEKDIAQIEVEQSLTINNNNECQTTPVEEIEESIEETLEPSN